MLVKQLISRRTSPDTSTERDASTSRSDLGTLRVGWEVRPSVSVSQNGDRSEVLSEIQQHFGCGTIRPDRSDQTLKWEVRSHELLATRVIPHFRRYPMRTG